MKRHDRIKKLPKLIFFSKTAIDMASTPTCTFRLSSVAEEKGEWSIDIETYRETGGTASDISVNASV
jgi:hypothetical protein